MNLIQKLLLFIVIINNLLQSSVNSQSVCAEISSNVDERCQHVRDYCQDELPGQFDYYELIYCQLPYAPGLSGFILFVWLLLLFVFISTAASEYFSPNVASITEILRISPDVAGVTLVALGNASNDIMGNLISFSRPETTQLALGGIVGAGLFLNCIVVGTIAVMEQNPIKLARKAVLRDESAYLIGLICFTVMVSLQIIYWYEGLILILFYIVYAVIIVITSNKKLRLHIQTQSMLMFGKIKNFQFIRQRQRSKIEGSDDHDLNRFSSSSALASRANYQQQGMGNPVIKIDSVDNLEQYDDQDGDGYLQEDDQYASGNQSEDIVEIHLEDLSSKPSSPVYEGQYEVSNSVSRSLNPPMERHQRSLSNPQSLAQMQRDFIIDENLLAPGSALTLPLGRTVSDDPHSRIHSRVQTTLNRAHLPVVLRDYLSDDDEDDIAIAAKYSPPNPSSLSRQLQSASKDLHLHPPSRYSSPEQADLEQLSHQQSEDLSENILNLRMFESLSRNRRNYSVSTAVELWNAYRQVHGQMSAPSDSASPPQIEINQADPAVFSMGLTREATPELGVPRIIEDDGKKSASGQQSHLSLGRERSKSAYSQQSSIGHRQFNMDLSLYSNLKLNDYCSICAKFTANGDTDNLFDILSGDQTSDAADKKEQIQSKKDSPQQIQFQMVYHLFPIIPLWKLYGPLSRTLAVLNVVPNIVFGLIVPVVALVEDDPVESVILSVDRPLSRRSNSINRNGDFHKALGSGSNKQSSQIMPHLRRNVSTSGQSSETEKSLDRRDVDAYIHIGSRYDPRYLQSVCEYGKLAWMPWKHRWLSIFQVFIAPLFVAFALNRHRDTLFIVESYQVQAWLLCIVIGILLASILTWLSRSGFRMVRVPLKPYVNKMSVCSATQCHYCRPLRKRTIKQRVSDWFNPQLFRYREYYPYLAFVGFVSGLMWIYLLSAEIVSVLKILGKLMGVSEGILGVTVFAFGNCVGDFATDVMIARLFYPQMAIGAAWGSPIVNVYITVGLAATVVANASWQRPLEVRMSPVILASLVGLLVVVVCNFLVLGWRLKFHLTKQYGYFLIIWWCLVVTVCAILEGLNL
ncbi:hypothetical protein MIR68_000772 [Amoeboaphelidium protococcarum]|nr:hypothetical protein MIR68_000772 [Amoeboaphelidium protococcarum]